VSSRIVWSLIAVGIAAQVVALGVWGHTTYLCIQGAEASAAAVLLFVFGLRFRRHDLRASRWPPLLPLAAIAVTGAAKDFCVASGVDTPAWLAALLLASVVWFLIASWLMWRAERQAEVAGKSNPDAEHGAAPDHGGITASQDSSSLSRRGR
jgi:hypothetical protein